MHESLDYQVLLEEREKTLRHQTARAVARPISPTRPASMSTESARPHPDRRFRGDRYMQPLEDKTEQEALDVGTAVDAATSSATPSIPSASGAPEKSSKEAATAFGFLVPRAPL